jgi:hypothetical protein
MNSQAANDELRGFHQFLGEKLKNGGSHLSPEEALDEWRDQHPEGVEFEDDTEAIQEALDDMANGDHGRPAKKVLSDLRRRSKSKTKNRKGPAPNGGARKRDERQGKHREPGEFPDDTEAILEAIHDMENGDTGRDFDEFMAEIRAKYGLPKR